MIFLFVTVPAIAIVTLYCFALPSHRKLLFSINTIWFAICAICSWYIIKPQFEPHRPSNLDGIAIAAPLILMYCIFICGALILWAARYLIPLIKTRKASAFDARAIAALVVLILAFAIAAVSFGPLLVYEGHEFLKYNLKFL